VIHSLSSTLTLALYLMWDNSTTKSVPIGYRGSDQTKKIELDNKIDRKHEVGRYQWLTVKH
jgi:hypothetical protein